MDISWETIAGAIGAGLAGLGTFIWRFSMAVLEKYSQIQKENNAEKKEIVERSLSSQQSVIEAHKELQDNYRLMAEKKDQEYMVMMRETTTAIVSQLNETRATRESLQNFQEIMEKLVDQVRILAMHQSEAKKE